MRRKSVLLGSALLLLLGGAVAGALALLLTHEPEFYQRAALPPGHEREQYSHDFETKCTLLLNGILNDRQWREKFTSAQINGYLEEDFVRSGWHDRLLPEGISDPRVSFGPGKIRVAFRYGGQSWWSTIVTIDFGVWLCEKDLNVVAMELQGLHAGSLPITAQSLLDRVSEVARRQDIEVTWYRLNGNPVALLRFQATQPRPTVRLERLELTDGQLLIVGRSAEAAPLRAMLGVPPTAFDPSAN